MTIKNARAGFELAGPKPHGVQHIVVGGLFFLCSFGLALPLLFGIRRFVPRSLSLDANPLGFSPVIANGVRVDYVGLCIPMILTIMSIAFIVWRVHNGSARAPSGTKYLLPIVVVALLVSKYTVLGLLPAVGLTDPILLFTLPTYAYWQVLNLPLTEAVPLTYSTGFFLGFMSDLESQLQSSGGIFGGHGFADGDFIYPIAFVFGAVVLSKTWPGIIRLIARADERLAARRR
jgi:hypothetical protein